MIASMTGFAAAAVEIPEGSLALELRAVNSRYLDLQFRLPDELRALEPDMRSFLGTRLKRGKIDCRLTFSAYAGQAQQQQLNHDALAMLSKISQEVRTVFPAAGELSVADILSWPDVFDRPQLSIDTLREPGMHLLETATLALITAREREGEKLQQLLLERLTRLRQLVRDVLPKLPEVLVAFQERLLSRLQAAGLDEQDERIRQEFTLFANRIDVDEELSRLQGHLDEFERILQTGGVVGKRLDFLAQELNREANTLASKSVDSTVTQVSVEMKVLIEQLREQVQNIE